MGYISEEYKQVNKIEVSDTIPDPPVPCAEPGKKFKKWLSNVIVSCTLLYI
jgi:hypothetical protein